MVEVSKEEEKLLSESADIESVSEEIKLLELENETLFDKLKDKSAFSRESPHKEEHKSAKKEGSVVSKKISDYSEDTKSEASKTQQDAPETISVKRKEPTIIQSKKLDDVSMLKTRSKPKEDKESSKSRVFDNIQVVPNDLFE